MRTSSLLALLLLLPAAAGARGSDLPRLGDFTAGGGIAGTAQPVEPGSPDTLLSPALTGEFNLLTPIFLSAGVHGRVEAMGPALGWDVSLGGILGGGTTLHGNGRTSGDVFVGIPIPVADDGWYLDLYARGGPFLDDTGEGYGLVGLSVKYSSWWDRVEGKKSRGHDSPPKKKRPPKKKKPTRPAPPAPKPADDGDGYQPRPRPDVKPDVKPDVEPDVKPVRPGFVPGTKPAPPAPRPH